MIMKEVVLTLQDVQNVLKRLETLYEFSTEDFINNSELHVKVQPDDFFEWMAMADHRADLLEQQAHFLEKTKLVQYLDELYSPKDCDKKPLDEQQLSLAA
jgi:hypothetical protein